MASNEQNLVVVPMFELVASILKDTAHHITEQQINTYFSEQERLIEKNGYFNPDFIQGLEYDDMFDIYYAEKDVLLQYGLIIENSEESSDEIADKTID